MDSMILYNPGIMDRERTLALDRSGFKPELGHFLVVWPWQSSFSEPPNDGGSSFRDFCED